MWSSCLVRGALTSLSSFLRVVLGVVVERGVLGEVDRFDGTVFLGDDFLFLSSLAMT